MTSPAPASGAENGKKIKNEEEEEERKKKLKMAIPAPKEEAANVDFLSVLDSIGNGGIKEEFKEEVLLGMVEEVKTEVKEETKKEDKVEHNNMFMIDKEGVVGDSLPVGEEEERQRLAMQTVRPGKQLKRRNAAMYSTDE